MCIDEELLVLWLIIHATCSMMLCWLMVCDCERDQFPSKLSNMNINQTDFSFFFSLLILYTNISVIFKETF